MTETNGSQKNTELGINPMTPGMFRSWRQYWRMMGELAVLLVGAVVIIAGTLLATWYAIGPAVDWAVRKMI